MQRCGGRPKIHRFRRRSGPGASDGEVGQGLELVLTTVQLVDHGAALVLEVHAVGLLVLHVERVRRARVAAVGQLMQDLGRKLLRHLRELRRHFLFGERTEAFGVLHTGHHHLRTGDDGLASVQLALLVAGVHNLRRVAPLLL